MNDFAQLLALPQTSRFLAEDRMQGFRLEGFTFYVFKSIEEQLNVLLYPDFTLFTEDEFTAYLGSKLKSWQEMKEGGNGLDRLNELKPVKWEEVFTRLLQLTDVHPNTAARLNVNLAVFSLPALKGRIHEDPEGRLCFPVKTVGRLENMFRYDEVEGLSFLNNNMNFVWHTKENSHTDSVFFHSEPRLMLAELSDYPVTLNMHMVLSLFAGNFFLQQLFEKLVARKNIKWYGLDADPTASLLVLRMICIRVSLHDSETEILQAEQTSEKQVIVRLQTRQKQPASWLKEFCSGLESSTRKEEEGSYIKAGQTSDNSWSLRLPYEALSLSSLIVFLIEWYGLPVTFELLCLNE